jgi:hypothetical protein
MGSRRRHHHRRLIPPERPAAVELLHGVGKVKNVAIDRVELAGRQCGGGGGDADMIMIVVIRFVVVVPKDAGRRLWPTLNHGAIRSIIADQHMTRRRLLRCVVAVVVDRGRQPRRGMMNHCVIGVVQDRHERSSQAKDGQKLEGRNGKPTMMIMMMREA